MAEKKKMSKVRSMKSQGGSTFKAVSYILFYLLLFLFIASMGLYAYSFISITAAEVLTTSFFSLLLPSLAFAYLARSGKSFSESLADLGIIQKLGLLSIIGIAIILFLLVLILELSITIASEAFNVKISTNACNAITGMPLWFILFVTLVGPFNEELFFRGFMVKRLGIVLSAAFFAVLHAGYGSSFGIDIIAAFIFGLVAGYIFKKTNSIYPTLFAHILVNLIAVLGCI
ncbi:MAG: lysostaphin resistance A-like protein [Candidatus Micrarchaeales archaeon]